jgi:hypothetical protein
MPSSGKACRRNTADITQSKYTQFHWLSSENQFVVPPLGGSV